MARGTQDNVPRHLIDQILADQQRMNADIEALKQAHPILMQRADPNNVTAPQEGQIVVDPNNEKVMYHSNREWRNLSHIITWARQELVSGSDVTVYDGLNAKIPFNTFTNNDPTTFAGMTDAIQVKQTGLYSITGQTQWSTYDTTPRQVWVALHSTREAEWPDDWAIATGVGVLDVDDYPIASGDFILFEDDWIDLWVHQDSGNAQTIYGGSYHRYPDGNWLEIRFLGPVT